VQGRKVRCKACGATFTAQAEPPARAKTAPAPAGKSDRAKPANKEAKAAAAAPEQDAQKPYEFMDDNIALEKIAKANIAPALPGVDTEPRHGMDIEKNPYGVTTLDLTPRRPHCAKEMEEGDIVCLNCGYNTQTRTHARTKHLKYITGKDWTLWLGPPIACAVAVLGLIGFCCWFEFALDWDDDNAFHRGVRIWVPVICAFPGYFATAFAVKRLLLHPRPPEVEKN